MPMLHVCFDGVGYDVDQSRMDLGDVSTDVQIRAATATYLQSQGVASATEQKLNNFQIYRNPETQDITLSPQAVFGTGEILHGTAILEVNVTIHDNHMSKVDAVAESLRQAGMSVSEVFAGIGVINGSVEISKISALSVVPGVLAVEPNRRVETQELCDVV